MKRASELQKFPVRLALLGVVASLLLLAGCASAPPQQTADQYNYNNTTGYPAVGLRPWNL
jgi:type IV pilus biogenesis protein CpaD/CtpE